MKNFFQKNGIMMLAAVTVVVMIALHLVTFFTRGTAWDAEDWAFVVQAFITGVAILVLAIPEGLPGEVRKLFDASHT